MITTNLLHPGHPFPALSVALPGRRALRLPGDLAGHFGVVLFYRGSWCPYCNAQLSAFQRSLDRLARLDVAVAALSVNDEATTQALIAKHGLQFPVGHSADARAIAAATGAFVNDDPLYLQPTGFVLDPIGRVIVSVYSSGAIGRLVPGDVIGLVRYLATTPASASPTRTTPTPSTITDRRQLSLGPAPEQTVTPDRETRCGALPGVQPHSGGPI
jgi:peroxiredoxin